MDCSQRHFYQYLWKYGISSRFRVTKRFCVSICISLHSYAYSKCRRSSRLVDAQGNRIIDATTSLSAKGIQLNLTVLRIKNISANSKYFKFQQHFQHLHHIYTTPGPSVFSKTRRLKPEFLRVTGDHVSKTTEN